MFGPKDVGEVYTWLQGAFLVTQHNHQIMRLELVILHVGPSGFVGCKTSGLATLLRIVNLFPEQVSKTRSKARY